MKRLACAWVILVLCVANVDAQTTLSVVSASPEGELSSLAQGNEVRIVFSEPMVALGRIPERVTAPFFRITPAVPGSLRWSGTTVLVFTPDPKRPLSFATEYRVTVAASATAVSGRRLVRPVSFTFTTPTAKLLNTNWYRVGGTVSGQPIIALRFNQPMRPVDVLASASAALKPHSWTPPSFTADEQARLSAMDPPALDRFNAKVRATQGVASSSAPVALKLATDWDKKQFPPSHDLVVLEVTSQVAPESWIE